MKVGKATTMIPSPIGAIIYATNMPPITVYRFGKSETQFAQDVQEAVNRYEQERKLKAQKDGELE